MSVGSKVHSLSTECAGIVSCEWEVVVLGLTVQGVEPVGALALICLVLFPLLLQAFLIWIWLRGGEGSVELETLCGPVIFGLEWESCAMAALRSPASR